MKLGGWLPAGVSFVLLLSPYGVLLQRLAAEWTEFGGVMAFPWDAKSVTALQESLFLGFAVTLTSLGLALVFVLLLARTPSPLWRLIVLAAAVIGFCLSSVLHLIAWRSLPFMPVLPPFVAATAILAWKYFPLALFMMLLGLHLLEPAGIEAGSTFGGPRRAMMRLVLPQMIWVMSMAGAMIFAQVFAEGEVPPLLGLRVYAEEFMSRIALDPYTGTAALASLPFIATAMLGAITLIFINAPARGLSWSRSGLPPLLRYLRPLPYVPIVGLLVALAVSWPWLVLMHSARLDALSGQDWQPLMTSLGLGLSSLAVAFVLAYPLAEVMGKPGRSRRWGMAVMILLICLPGSLLGLGMVALSQSPGLEWLNTGDVALILTHGLRFAPFAALLLLGLKLLQPRWMREELSLTGAGRMAALCHIYVPLEWPKWLLIGVVLLALTFSELASTILVVSPGTETAILRLYNLMHFGAAERVAALAMSQALLVTVIFVASGGLLMRYGHHA